jgi:hypothetical protein
VAAGQRRRLRRRHAEAADGALVGAVRLLQHSTRLARKIVQTVRGAGLLGCWLRSAAKFNLSVLCGNS